jgi:hypothetical protein
MKFYYIKEEKSVSQVETEFDFELSDQSGLLD